MNATKPKRKFTCLKILLALFLLAIVAAVGGFFWLQNWYNNIIIEPNSSDTSIVKLEIKKGTSAADIGKLLKENNLIKDEVAWQAYIKLNNPSFLADQYALPKNLSIVAIAKVLEIGQKDEVVWVTIPEGLRMDEIEVILDSKLSALSAGKYDKTEFHKLINAPDEFLLTTANISGPYISGIKPEGKSLEGFLFPDTYAFRIDVNTKEVLVTLLANFMAKTKDITPANGLSFYENLIIASIVERESFPEDNAGVASVFLKRIGINEKLGSDITVLYILKRWNPEPTAKELLIDSPYNTRKNYGIPPTPIANPGLAAISSTEAAKPGDYLFFLADENGKIRYGKNVSEHNRNICKYLTKTCK